MCSGRKPSSVCASTSALAFNSTLTTSTWPRSLATPSGVTPEAAFRKLGSAPFDTSFFTCCVSPRCAAVPSRSPRVSVVRFAASPGTSATYCPGSRVIAPPTEQSASIESIASCESTAWSFWIRASVAPAVSAAVAASPFTIASACSLVIIAAPAVPAASCGVSVRPPAATSALAIFEHARFTSLTEMLVKRASFTSSACTCFATSPGDDCLIFAISIAIITLRTSPLAGSDGSIFSLMVRRLLSSSATAADALVGA